VITWRCPDWSCS